MRRIYALVLLVALLFTACAKTAPLPEPSFKTEIKTEMFTDGHCGVMLQYPAIRDYADKDAASLMNRLMKEYAHRMYESAGLSPEEDYGYTYAVSGVKITLASGDFLSACVDGTISSVVSGNVSYFSYTLNCDIKNGVLYTSEDVFSDYSGLKKQFLKGRFTQAFGHAELTEKMTLTDLISQYKEDYGIYPEVYFSENGIGFLVDTVPMLDGYAGFTLPYRTAKKYLNEQNPFVAYVTE